MNIIVCIKQVPDTTEVKIDPQTNTLIREGVASIINPFDMYAIEEGIRLKEKYGGKVTVISMGPPQAEEALREAISMGCDEAILITDRAFAGSDTWATSYTLAKAIEKIGDFDLIICGKQAIDGDTAQVGPGISAHLDLPQVTYVKKIEEIKISERQPQKASLIHTEEIRTPEHQLPIADVARVERMMEEGYEVVEVPLPCLITVVKEINEPRLPSLKGKLRARCAEIKKWGIQDLGLDKKDVGLEGSPTRVVKIFTPPPRKGGQILEGETKEVVEKLVELLKSEII
ncbi:MAG: electron transfer flavoprotein subunit beta/FixA family protein [Candidatus Omnitrophica bacterium]|nr:electron transfer flavoprotein subunit beta/FixA family protein [Candidatus Omnitrophota bacterium]